MSHLLKILIATLCTIVLAGAAYFFLHAKSAEEDLAAVATGAVRDDAEIDVSMRTEKILSDTQKINTYSLEGESIFKDTRFSSLKYYRKEIDDVKTGRENPFQPIN